MSLANKILHEEFIKHDINGIDTPNSVVWKVITQAMERYGEESDTSKGGETIGEVMKENMPECKHDWIYCGDNFTMCGKEGCSAWFIK